MRLEILIPASIRDFSPVTSPEPSVQRHHRRFWFAVLACILALCLPWPAAAQVARGTITGRITDPAGAVIPGATVVAVETANGSRYNAVSDSAGDYTIPFLAPGTYRVSTSVSGFRNFVREGVIVDSNEHVSSDIQLSVGEQAETVTVTSGETLLETVTASTGQTLNTEDVENLPVDGNTPLIVSQLAMGVVPTGNPQFFHPYDNSGPSGFAIGGGAAAQNELLLDGAPDGQGDGTIAFNPPMDAVQQVKVEAFQADAAYGHTAGGTVDQILKSGTNQYHGTLYEYGQWSALNDTNWFTKNAGQVKAVSRFNQYGGSIGGPISIPKVYSGHNKLFFFFGFEGIQDNAPSPSYVTVPTDAEKQGDFSALLPLGSSYTIYNPASGVLQSNGQVLRQPFLNNKITTPLDPVAQKLLSYYAEPNVPGTANGENNYYTPGNSTDSFDSETGRIDVNLGNRDKLFYDFRHNNRYHTSGNVFNNVASGSILVQPNWGSTADEVHIFTPQTVWENRANWTRNITSRPLQTSVPLAQLGFPAGLQAAATVPGFPVTSLSPFVGYGYSKGQYLPFDSFQVFSIVNHELGKHSLELGADMRLYKEWSFSFGNADGSYTFTPTGGLGWTNGPYNNSGAAPVGQELAAFELGLPTAGSFDVNTNETTSAKYYAIFLQDNYRILPNLTLNLGVRYEHDFPTVESNNKAVNGFAASTVSPINSQAQANFAAHPASGVTFPTLMGGLTFAGSNQRSFYQTKTFNFSPRIGVAYTPMQGTSIRGGFGIFNDSVGRQNPISPGYNQTTQMQVTTNNYLSPSATLSNPFPTGLLQPPGSSQGLATYLGQSISFYPQLFLNDYSIRWDLDFQQEFPGHTLFELGYVGNHAVHIGVSKALDYVPGQYLNVGQVRNAAVISNLTGAVPNPFAGLLPGTSINGSTVARSQLLMTYPQYAGVTMTSDPVGSSLYDMLEARIEKRMSHGIRFLGVYSWSKKLDRVDYLNAQDSSLEKRISADDRPQHLVASGTWELPFGHGRRYDPSIPVANYLISGWNLTPVYTFQPDGAPLAWGDIIYLGSSLNALQLNPHNPNAAFDTTQFDTKSADQPVTGDHIRTLPTQVAHARADGINSLDVSLVKENRITERVHLQLRGDWFNALNRPQFAAPSLSPTSSSFGKSTSQANLPRQTQVELKLSF